MSGGTTFRDDGSLLHVFSLGLGSGALARSLVGAGSDLGAHALGARPLRQEVLIVGRVGVIEHLSLINCKSEKSF